MPDSFDRFAERLKIAIGDSKIVSFAKLCGFGESLIRQYLSGKTIPGADKLVIMAKAAEVSLEWLATGEGVMRPGEARASPPPPATQESLPVPVYSLSPSAGAGAFCDGDFIEEWIQIPRAIIDWMAVPIKFLTLTRVSGLSMTPTLTDGELIFADRRFNRVIGEGIYVIRFENTLLVKRVQVQPGGVLQIISDNPAFPPFTISPKAPPSDFSILARVVSHLRKL